MAVMVDCPQCNERLELVATTEQHCSRCKAVFTIPTEDEVSDDDCFFDNDEDDDFEDADAEEGYF